jgi:flagella basal body P-ring formation protein FlgA
MGGTVNQQTVKIFLTLLFIITGIFVSNPCSALEILVSERVDINGETIRLGDVASFNPSDDNRIPLLRDIEISAAPKPNTDYRINKSLLLYKLTPHISGDSNILLKVPENLFVHRHGQMVSSEEISRIFTNHIIKNSPWEPERIFFERINASDNLYLPVGSLDWEVDDRLNNEYMGNISLMVSFSVDGRVERRVSVSGRVSVSRDVVKVTRRIKKGDILSAGDLTVVAEKTDRFRGNVMTEIYDAIGKMALRTIQADTMLLEGMIENPPMVQKGDRVIIKAESRGIKITAAGKVLEDGRPGDLVRVVNINSGKELYATVKRSDLVEVSF